MAQCATTALAGAVPRPCVCGARGGFGGLGPLPGVVCLPFPPSRPACPALRVAGRPLGIFFGSSPFQSYIFTVVTLTWLFKLSDHPSFL